MAGHRFGESRFRFLLLHLFSINKARDSHMHDPGQVIVVGVPAFEGIAELGLSDLVCDKGHGDGGSVVVRFVELEPEYPG